MKNRKRINSRSRQAGQIKIIEKKKECRVLERDAGTKENIQRVSEISTLILTGDRPRYEQQNCYVPFFRNVIFILVFYPPPPPPPIN
jgi:hypothetical protein